MRFLFWLFLIMNLLLALFTLAAKQFRESFGAGTSLNQIFLFIYIVVSIAGLFMYFSPKPKWISVLLVALPLAGLFLLYVIDKLSGRG